jgi:hypothetical protein
MKPEIKSKIKPKIQFKIKSLSELVSEIKHKLGFKIKSKINSNLKILVFMSDNRKLQNEFEEATYNSLVASINYEYCKKYNYDFIYYRPYLDSENNLSLYNCIDPNTKDLRHASWSKLISTHISLQLDYDYVVYIDSDCIFKNFNLSLEHFINQNIDINIIFFSNHPWGAEKPNAGFFICKVSEYTKNFIIDWYNVDISKKNLKHPWEQDALWKIYELYNVIIVDNIMFIECDDQFLRHVCTNEAYNRLSYFKNFIDLNKIIFNKNILEIKNIDYDSRLILLNSLPKHDN